MSDDMWRHDDEASTRRQPGPLEAEMDSFDDEEFGGPLFGDTVEQPVASGASDAKGSDDADAQRLSLGDDSTGPLPHWTEAATGDVPRIEAAGSTPDPTDDLDVWSTFTSDAPVWNEGDRVDDPSGPVPTAPADPTGEINWEDAPATTTHDTIAAAAEAMPTGAPPVDAAHLAATAGTTAAARPDAAPEPSRITIGTDPSGMPRRPAPQRRGGAQQRPPSAGGPPVQRNLPVAVASGLLLAAVFIGLSMWRPAGVMAFVVVALGLAAVEYFTKVTEKGYRPAVAVGVAACVTAPLVAYWVGERYLPLVLVLAFLAGSAGFIGADSIEVGPMPNMAITTLGIVWIGLFGSYAALILRFNIGDNSYGTDTLVLIAIGVVANDVGAYFVGSAFGRTPMRRWISPNKSIEGLFGGAILTLMVMGLVSMLDASDTWSSTAHLLMLGIVISIFAPLGDLTESMFKRNLDVKDFGTLIRGHGGVLDRFDGFLFALPAAYYLFLVIEPWTAL